MIAYPTYKGNQYTVLVDNEAAKKIADKAFWDGPNNRWTVYKPWHTTLANALWSSYTGERAHGGSSEGEGFTDPLPTNPSTQMYNYSKSRLAPYFKKSTIQEAVEKLEKAIARLEEAWDDDEDELTRIQNAIESGNFEGEELEELKRELDDLED